MTRIDDALAILRQDMHDPKSLSVFYDLILNSNFFVPTLPEDDPDAAAQGAMPLIIEAQGHDYLLLFDTRERLESWAGGAVAAIEVPGHLLAATTEPPLRWALNPGQELTKEFLPDEIGWLKGVVERCLAEAEAAP